MKYVFEIETSEADEKALRHVYAGKGVEFAMQSILPGVVSGARQLLLNDIRMSAAEKGETLVGSDDLLIILSSLPNAQERHDLEASRLQEMARREQEEAERIAKERAEEDERNRAAEDERVRLAAEAAAKAAVEAYIKSQQSE